MSDKAKPALGGGVIPEFEMILNDKGERALTWTCPKCKKFIVGTSSDKLSNDAAEHIKSHGPKV